jgi:nucleoside-diphosphate-sugar epimerase
MRDCTKPARRTTLRVKLSRNLVRWTSATSPTRRPVNGRCRAVPQQDPVQDTYVDTTRIRRGTGYQPEYGLTGGLADITPQQAVGRPIAGTASTGG